MTDNLQVFIDSVVDAGQYASSRRLLNQTQYLLGNVSQVGNALDIGGGSGVMSFYVASQGARKVICLEPVSDGSTDRITDSFRSLQRVVPFGYNVDLVQSRIQDYAPGDMKFDLIMSFNAINHLDEKACIDLKTNRASYDRYIVLFRNFFEMLNSGGKIVITDCSRYNFFSLIHVKNPFMRSIEWNKHQSPYMWISMFKEVGFVKPKVQWTSYNSLGRVGRVLMGNVIVNYFTLSHFKFTMFKP